MRAKNGFISVIIRTIYNKKGITDSVHSISGAGFLQPETSRFLRRSSNTKGFTLFKQTTADSAILATRHFCRAFNFEFAPFLFMLVVTKGLMLYAAILTIALDL